MKQQERWERIAFEFHTRPNRAPRNIGRDDLMIGGPGSTKMLAGTLLAAVGITAMLVWPISTIFLIVTGLHAPNNWYWGVVGALTLVFWATLYTLAVRETAGDRRYAERLRQPG